MDLGFSINKDDLSKSMLEDIERNTIFFYIRYFLIVGVFWSIGNALGKKYFPNDKGIYATYMIYISIIFIISLGLKLLLWKKKYSQNFEIELSKNGLDHFISNDFLVKIEEEGLYIKDNKKETRYCWDFVAGYYEVNRYIYIGDSLDNIIVIIPLSKIEVEKSMILQELKKYIKESKKLNKKYKILDNVLK